MRDAAFRDLGGQGVAIGRGDHFHVRSGAQGHSRRLRVVGSESPGNQLVDSLPIADDESRELPLIPKNLREEEPVCSRRNAVVCVERAHQRDGSCPDSRVKSRQEKVAHGELRDLRVIVVAASDRGAIAGEMLEAGGDPLAIGEARALKAAHCCGRIEGGEEGIFTKRLGDAAPTRVTGQVAHRPEDPINARRAAFPGGHSFQFFEEARIPRAGKGKWNRENRPQAVNGVKAEH